MSQVLVNASRALPHDIWLDRIERCRRVMSAHEMDLQRWLRRRWL